MSTVIQPTQADLTAAEQIGDCWLTAFPAPVPADIAAAMNESMARLIAFCMATERANAEATRINLEAEVIELKTKIQRLEFTLSQYER